MFKATQQLFTLIVILLAFATTASAAVVINEIMYNTPGSPDIEWLELYNSGDSAIELDDWYLLDSDPLHPICLLSGDLGPGQFLVVVGDFNEFTPQYPGVSNVNVNDFDPNGTGFGLSNSSDTINLYDDDGELQDTVTYFDSGDWPNSADGDGPSLELVSPLLENNVSSAWDPSLVTYGTPGQQNSTFMDNQAPIIHDTDREPRLPVSGQDVLITALVSDQEGLQSVELFVDIGAGFVVQAMIDDGNHGDGAAADSLFGASIASQPDGTLVKYYVQATDALGQITTKPSTAPVAYRAYTVGHMVPPLFVSEIVANNATGMVDEMGENDDWVEIWNGGLFPVDLTGMYLTDNLGDHRNWMLPSVVLQPAQFYIVWCDGDTEQGINHASFGLASSGEEIGLYDNEEGGNTIIDGFIFGIMAPDASYGMVQALDKSGKIMGERGQEYYAIPSPGFVNNGTYLSDVVINEFQTTSLGGGVDDWVEFYNRGEQTIDISGWWVSDDRATPMRWSFPPGTMLQPDSHYLVDEITLGFSFSSSGEEVMLTESDGITGMDFQSFGVQQPDVSLGRTNDGIPYWSYFDVPTPGTANIDGDTSDADGNAAPTVFRVDSAYPNPFNPSTTISFTLPQSEEVVVKVYSLDGRLVRTINAGVMGAGSQKILFNGMDDFGCPLASGTWFATVRTGSASDVVKMLLLK